MPSDTNSDEHDPSFGSPGRSYGPTSFDSPVVNAIAPPLVAGLAILARLSPLGFLLEGFHVWIHELGHASAAWLASVPAVPLPIGWTNVGHAKSLGLYLGALVAIGALAWAGWRERKAWPMLLAAALFAAQTYMTWFMRADTARMWMIFGGVGGEFYLAAAMMGLFYFEFPDSFRWGACRYVVVFLGAASFFETYSFWRSVARGQEGIPYGSMINGEEDGGGDMNILFNEYKWTQHQIIGTYSHLGQACLVALAIVYLYFNLRLNRVFSPILARCYSIGLSKADE